MRICLIASSRYPIREPFAGGLEAMTHTMVRGLAARGHDVTLFAGPGSDASLPARVLPLKTFTPSAAALADRNAPPPAWLADHHAYLGLMLELARTGADDYDVIHNHSLHPLPLAMAPAVGVPMLTTLHTPPLPLIESAMSLGGDRSSFVAVSGWTSRAWSHVVPSRVITNGLDLAAWTQGPGGGPAVWSGRLVPEKAPHHAMEAAQRAGLPLVLAGPVQDESYFAREIAPRLTDDVTYAGHLTQEELAGLVRGASVTVVTPMWDEPYGLVAAESIACGTPVAGYARGGLPEVVGDEGGFLVARGDVDALADAMHAARRLDRDAVRRHAVRTCGAEAMIDAYERLYLASLGTGAAA
ncbi:MAG: glycosyl transferase family 1 [Nocardioides sp.]|jgi:glycosyltransferase involved in cell wall biosynthesis|uniref:glycosyltransferase family 4 protein n=1 Tax=Nocardioides sp. TaxID=35761 RepID=UPI002625A9DB|nr:glycosyltransferase family 4 protein [Nocardioides sp.]MCW2834811.1 glycosyl transferase family 1 [Nocardioides sp.]